MMWVSDVNLVNALEGVETFDAAGRFLYHSNNVVFDGPMGHPAAGLEMSSHPKVTE